VIPVVLAVCAAVSNAVATVLQRRAARDAPSDERLRLALIVDLIQQPAWLGGIAALIAGFGFQAAALSKGELALVQPILAVELPLTLFVAGRVFHRSVGRRARIGAAMMAAGLAALLLGLAPRSGTTQASLVRWVVAILVVAVMTAVLVVFGRVGGSIGACLLGAAAGLDFGLTAALMKAATDRLPEGLAAVFGSWQLYAMVAVGILSLFLLQNALQSGTLVAAQPAVTCADPVAGVLLGVFLFHEPVRLGGWLTLELFGVAAVLAGSIELARSPVLAEEQAESQP
jgi:drug/metabolite transporter (DMT)-like permease